MPRMRIEVLETAEDVARRAADIVCDALRAKADAVLGLPTGSTPLATYAELARRCDAGECDLSRATVFAIDEFIAPSRTTPGTNSAYYHAHLRIRPRALHCPDPAASNPDEHIAAYADALRRAGGFDLLLLGVGTNGHIAFNEPGSPRESRARVVTLAPETRAAYAAAFGGQAPERGMTLGVADLLEARRIVVLATGASKAAAVAAAVDGPATAAVPASWLREHDAVTWLLNREAAAALRANNASA